MFYYINNFFLFSIFGFFLETLMFSILGMHNQSGFLHLFWTPFYGTGVIITILLNKFIKNKNMNKLWQTLTLIFSLFFILSLLELIGGIFLEKLFGYSLWSYNNIPLHVGKYISVPTSIGWVCFSFFYLLFIKKYTDKLVSRIPKFVSISLLIIFIADNIVTILETLKFRDFI